MIPLWLRVGAVFTGKFTGCKYVLVDMIVEKNKVIVDRTNRDGEISRCRNTSLSALIHGFEDGFYYT